MKPEIRIYKDGNAVAQAFTDFLKAFVAGRDRVTIALSGGSTPKLLFDLLAREPEALDWEKIHLFWGDERCVPPDHDDSNYKMTWEHLLQHLDIPEENIHRVKGEDDPESEARRYGEEMKKYCTLVDGLPSIDLNLLGMGDDGHTASIFPHQIELLTASSVCAVAMHPTSGQQRVTMTGPVINNSGTIAFLVTGDKKAEKIGAILGGGADAASYPASHITGREGLYWFLDEAAHQLVR